MHADDEMYTQENLDRRYSLRHEATVAALLRKWWKAVERLLAWHKTDKMREPEYCLVFGLIYKVMMPVREYDEADARDSVRDDWDNDAHGKKHMDPSDFMDGARVHRGSRCKSGCIEPLSHHLLSVRGSTLRARGRLDELHRPRRVRCLLGPAPKQGDPRRRRGHGVCDAGRAQGGQRAAG